MAKKAKQQTKVMPNGAIFYGDPLPFPISRAVRAGDFVTTSAFGCYMPAYDDQVYDGAGLVLSTGKHRSRFSFADEVHGTFKYIIDALELADCTLADVIDTQVWLRDGRDFAEMNRIYATYFTENRPIRTVFHTHCVMEFRMEMKVVAYKPLGKSR